jgi:hypothetical protein
MFSLRRVLLWALLAITRPKERHSTDLLNGLAWDATSRGEAFHTYGARLGRGK